MLVIVGYLQIQCNQRWGNGFHHGSLHLPDAQQRVGHSNGPREQRTRLRRHQCQQQLYGLHVLRLLIILRIDFTRVSKIILEFYLYLQEMLP